MKSSVVNLLLAVFFAGLFVWYALTESPISQFLFGLGLLALFLWYFATDLRKRKGAIGSILTFLLAALCVQSLWWKKLNKTDERLKYEGLTAEDVVKVRDAIQSQMTTSGFIKDSEDKRLVFPYKVEGSFNADTKLAFKKTYDGGVGRVYVIDGTDKHAKEGVTAKDWVNVYKFWEADAPKKPNTPPKPMPKDMGLVWNNLIGVCNPFDKTPGEIPIERGIDLAGGSSFVVRIDRPDDREASDKEQTTVIGVLSDRLNQFGGKDLLIAPQGEDRILVQMPGIDDEQRDAIKSVITKASVLSFHIVDAARQADAPAVARNEKVVPGMMAVKAKRPTDGTEGYYLLSRTPNLEGKYVSRAWASVDGANNWNIMVDFNSEGANIFGKLTNDNIGKALAIKLDDEVLSAPRINGAIFGTTEISGDFTQEEAVSLASSLQNPLENPLAIETESSVDPALGDAAVKQGMFAAAGGLVLTLLFVLVYYRKAGLIAIVGLAFTLLFLLGAMAMFGFTLTLPGIAGIILTIGVAVDANVLIYERLKEELEEGHTLGTSVNSAYSKAFSAIFDANFTSLITAVILFYVASGPVKGFAVTLVVGILGSMFAALVITRIIFNWALDSGSLKKLTFWEFIPQKRFDFLGRRKLAFIVSGVLMFTFIAGWAVRRDKALGVDFRGGHLFTLKVADPAITPERVSQALTSLQLPEEPIVQTQVSRSDNSRYLTIRMVAKKDPQAAATQVDDVKALLKNDLKIGDETPIQNDSVGSAVGSELLWESILALGLGMLGILLYVTLRFEFSFAMGAIVALLHDVVATIGIVILLGHELSLVTVGAFLTVAGYSINDTIVVFDRLREWLKTRSGSVEDLMNDAISSTLRRTLLTSGTTLLALVTLWIFGGPSLQDFALAIFVGIVVGTYSSIFVATPIVYWWSKRQGKSLRTEIREAEEGFLPPGMEPGAEH